MIQTPFSLQNDLQVYYGELMQRLETSHDYFERIKIKNHMKAIMVLLNLAYYS